jgi:hypothetical protein
MLEVVWFYQILTAFKKLKIMSEVVLLLPSTDFLQQVEDYVGGCTFLPNTDRLQQVEDYVRCCIILPNTDCLQEVVDYVRICITCSKYWPPSTSWRRCQRLYYFYQILIAFNKLKIMSGIVLLLRNTDRLHQVEHFVTCCSTLRLCQRLFHF